MKKIMVIILGALIAACGSSPDATPPPPVAGEQGEPQAVTPTFDPFATVPPELLPPTQVTLEAVPPEVLTTVELHERLDPFASEICQLPCYGGLEPGDGALQDVIAFYSQLGIAVVDLTPGDFNEARDGTGHLTATLMRTTDITQADDLGLRPPQVDVYLEENTVQYVYMAWPYQPPYLTASDVLTTLGPPSRAEVGVTQRGEQNLYTTALTYTGDAGSYAFAFIGRLDAVDEGQRLCFDAQSTGATYLGTFAPNVTPLDGLFDYRLVPLPEALDLPVADFTTQVGSGDCVTMPTDAFERLSAGR